MFVDVLFNLLVEAMIYVRVKESIGSRNEHTLKWWHSDEAQMNKCGITIVYWQFVPNVVPPHEGSWYFSVLLLSENRDFPAENFHENMGTIHTCEQHVMRLRTAKYKHGTDQHTHECVKFTNEHMRKARCSFNFCTFYLHLK